MRRARAWVAEWSLHRLSIDREWWITLHTPFGYAQLVLGRPPREGHTPHEYAIADWWGGRPGTLYRVRGDA